MRTHGPLSFPLLFLSFFLTIARSFPSLLRLFTSSLSPSRTFDPLTACLRHARFSRPCSRLNCSKYSPMGASCPGCWGANGSAAKAPELLTEARALPRAGPAVPDREGDDGAPNGSCLPDCREPIDCRNESFKTRRARKASEVERRWIPWTETKRRTREASALE